MRSRRTVFGLVACVVAAVAGLSSAPAANAIAHGTPAPDGAYAFSTKLTMTNIPRTDGTFYNSACSGALIAQTWVLTAGHCFHDPARNRVSGPVPYPTTATIGRTDLSDTTKGVVVNVVEVFQSASNDVALAKLATPVTGIAPLPIAKSAPVVGEVLRIAGWGAVDSTSGPVDHLITGQVKVSSLAAANAGVVGYAPSPDTSACPYDSGAPYFRELAGGKYALVLAENTGPDCPHATEETTARTDVLQRWILQTIRAN